MIREEWRMHSRLFGTRSFEIFPLFLFTVATILYAFLTRAGITVQGIETGLIGLVFLLGLNVGAIGFVSRDAIQNLLGESNLLIFSSRTLPLSEQRIVATFILKDLLYYTMFYLLPVSLAIGAIRLWLGMGIAVIPSFLMAVIGSFMLGVSLSLLSATLYLRSRWSLPAMAAVIAGLLAYFGPGIVAFTPLAFYQTGGLADLFFGFAPIVVLSLLGVTLFRHSSRRRSRGFDETYTWLASRLPAGKGLVAKNLLDVMRSSGGLWKIVFSHGVIILLFAYGAVETVIGQRFLFAPVFSFSILLALASLSTYNWLNRFDRAETYLKFPLSHDDLFRGKFISFLLLALPVSYLMLGLVALGFGTRGLVGVVLLPATMVYVLGVTAWIAGFEPQRMLFDTRTFVVFTVLLSIVTVPLFILALLYPDYPTTTSIVALAVALVAAGAGVLAGRRAGPRWGRRTMS